MPSSMRRLASGLQDGWVTCSASLTDVGSSCSARRPRPALLAERLRATADGGRSRGDRTMPPLGLASLIAAGLAIGLATGILTLGIDSATAPNGCMTVNGAKLCHEAAAWWCRRTTHEDWSHAGLDVIDNCHYLMQKDPDCVD